MDAIPWTTTSTRNRSRDETWVAKSVTVRERAPRISIREIASLTMSEMLGSFLLSRLVGFSNTDFTRTQEPRLSWNQLHSWTRQRAASLLRRFIATQEAVILFPQSSNIPYREHVVTLPGGCLVALKIMSGFPQEPIAIVNRCLTFLCY